MLARTRDKISDLAVPQIVKYIRDVAKVISQGRILKRTMDQNGHMPALQVVTSLPPRSACWSAP